MDLLLVEAVGSRRSTGFARLPFCGTVLSTKSSQARMKAPTKSTLAKLVCPQPGSFSIADEAYRLLALVQQMGLPVPNCFDELYPATKLNQRFSLDQVRYVIRRDWQWTALHCARAGVLIEGLDPDEARVTLARLEGRDEDPQLQPLFGRWPEPTPEVQDIWEERKKAYFDDLLTKTELSSPDMAFVLALVVAQCGWPIPALVSRLFPADSVTRRLPASLAATALKRSGDFELLDAVMAGTPVWELTRPGIEAFSARQSTRDLAAIHGHLDPRDRLGWLRHFFGRQRQGPVALRGRLKMQMRDTINSADRKPEHRITLQAFAQAKEIFSPSKTKPIPRQPPPAPPEEEVAETAEMELQDATPPGAVEAVDEAPPKRVEPAAKQAEVLEARSDIWLAELRRSIETTFRGPLSDLERRKEKLSSSYQGISTIDVVRTPGADRPVPLAKALPLFGLDPYPDPSDLPPGPERDDWHDIIRQAQSNAIRTCDIESEYVKFMLNQFQFPRQWSRILSIYSDMRIEAWVSRRFNCDVLTPVWDGRRPANSQKNS